MPLLSAISASAIRKHITSRHYCLISIIWTGEALQTTVMSVGMSVCPVPGPLWVSLCQEAGTVLVIVPSCTGVWGSANSCSLFQTSVSVWFFLGLRSLIALREKGQPIRTPDLNEVVKLGEHHGETLLRGRKNLTALWESLQLLIQFSMSHGLERSVVLSQASDPECFNFLALVTWSRLKHRRGDVDKAAFVYFWKAAP